MFSHQVPTTKVMIAMIVIVLQQILNWVVEKDI